MPITINGTGSITGISAGGLPDASIVADDLASNAVTTAKISDANITAAKLSGAQSGSAPIYGARAWVNFNGTSTVAIRASGNVSSITDNGTGDYTVNFTTAMADADYSFAGAIANTSDSWVNTLAGAIRGAGGIQNHGSTAPTSSALRIETLYGSSAASDGGKADFSAIYVAIFR